MLGREDRPDDVLEFGRDRRPRGRWRSRALLAGLVLAASLVAAIRTGVWSSSSSRAHHARPAASGLATPSVAVPRIRVIATGRHLLGVTAGWELLARGLDDLVRIQLAKGQITWTSVPLLASGGAVAFMATAHEALIRPSDYVPGYVVPDNRQARLLTGPLASGGPLIPGVQGTETFWGSTETQTTRELSLVTLDGRRVGPIIRFPAHGPQLPATAASDGRGDVLVASSGSSFYDAGPTWDRPVPGTIIAVGPASWLTVICDARSEHCHNELVDSTDDSGRALPGTSRAEPFFFTWPPAGVISPDGAMAAVAGRVVVGESGGQLNAVHLIDLRTGATKDLRVRAAGTTGSPLGTATGEDSMAWSPDSRWLFVATASGKLLAVNPRSGLVKSLGIKLPQVQQVAIRR
ncbi:MAG TPA: hypothetical protein VGM14_22495 [Streptosporangiaceae bacterium]